MEVVGYADRLSVRPGETIRFMASCTQRKYRADIVRLKSELDDIAASNKLSAELKAVRDEFEAVLSGAAATDAKGSAA